MIDQIVEKYITLRDKKAVFKAEYEAKVAEIEVALDRIESHLMTRMQEQGLKSLPTSAGTAYIQHRTSVTTADWASFLGFVREHDAWNMLEKRPSKSAVEEFKEANNDLPPGINWTESVVVNVKRS
jgi:hypothetical protein